MREYISKESLYLMGIPSGYQGKFLSDYHFAEPKLKSIIQGYVTNPRDMLNDCVNPTGGFFYDAA